jgi:hypothetical protein
MWEDKEERGSGNAECNAQNGRTESSDPSDQHDAEVEKKVGKFLAEDWIKEPAKQRSKRDYDDT